MFIVSVSHLLLQSFGLISCCCTLCSFLDQKALKRVIFLLGKVLSKYVNICFFHNKPVRFPNMDLRCIIKEMLMKH